MEKEEIVQQIDNYGGVYLHICTRDCDMVESDYTSFWEVADWNEWTAEIDRFSDGLEGPCSMNLISREEHKGHQTTSRDRVMEAYENGRGNSIYV